MKIEPSSSRGVKSTPTHRTSFAIARPGNRLSDDQKSEVTAAFKLYAKPNKKGKLLLNVKQLPKVGEYMDGDVDSLACACRANSPAPARCAQSRRKRRTEQPRVLTLRLGLIVGKLFFLCTGLSRAWFGLNISRIQQSGDGSERFVVPADS